GQIPGHRHRPETASIVVPGVSSLATCTLQTQELTEEAFTVPELTSAQLSEEFPGNEWLVADIYEKYKADQSSVDEKWAEIFARLESANDAESQPEASNGKTSQQKSADPQTAAAAEPAPSSDGAKSAATDQKSAEQSKPAASLAKTKQEKSKKPPKPKVRRAEESPQAITSEPSISARED